MCATRVHISLADYCGKTCNRLSATPTNVDQSLVATKRAIVFLYVSEVLKGWPDDPLCQYSIKVKILKHSKCSLPKSNVNFHNVMHAQVLNHNTMTPVA